MKQYSLLLLMFLVSLSLYGQKAKSVKSLPQYPQVDVTHAQFLGKTPPLRNLVPLNPTSQERREMNEDRKRVVPNFSGRRPTPPAKEGAKPVGEDPIRQTAITRSLDIPVEPLVNIEGMNENDSGASPPDPCGDIGGTHYVQMINATSFQVFDKEGNEVSQPIAANTIWSQVGFQSAGDPIILFDQEVNRWIITEFPFGNTLLVAISDEDDPLGSWNAYAFSTPSFPDYPKYSIWNNALCVTTNENGPGSQISYFINREDLLTGAMNPRIQRVTLPGVTGGPGFFVSTPVDWTGQNPPPMDAKPMILRLSDDAWGSVSTEDAIEVYELDIDWDSPGNTSFTGTTVFTAPFNTAACAAPGSGFACIPQLNGGGIDGIPETIMHQVHYRNFGSYEVMVLNFLVNAGGANIIAGIRWMEMRRMPGGNWEVYQEGTFAPADGKHRFMGGICMDGNGNIGLGYSISSSSDHPGLGFTGRRSSDPLGEMTVDEFVIVEGSGVNPGSRYGDYAQLTVDPADDRTFWYTGEYRRNSTWGTRIFAFQLGRDTIDIGPTALVSPVNSPDLSNAEPVRVEMKNFGIDTQSVFSIGYVFENQPPVIDPVSVVLPPDSTYVHSFAQTVDMSVVGDYNFTIFTSLVSDNSPLNDTLRFVRSKLSRDDAGIAGIEGLDGANCVTEITADLELTNFGTNVLNSVTIEVELNGSLFTTIDWTGSLNPGATETVQILLTGLTNGQNTVTASTSNPNGVPDEIMINDSFTRNFNVLTNGAAVFLELLTDDYPGETTWEVTDENGQVIYSGGPYPDQVATLISVEFCLDPAACYDFTIFDSFGDGICCGYGIGSISINDENGNPLAQSDGVFGFSQTLDFCTIFDCMMDASVDVTPETTAGAADGTIMITQMNGIGPFQYSIDGGTTFQSGNLFEGVAAGEYEIIVLGEFDCFFEGTATVPLCALDATIQITDEIIGEELGRIFISGVNNGDAPYEYSIDGGATFQSSPIFAGLSMGDYDVVVRDDAGCVFSITVTVKGVVDAHESLVGQSIEVFPNPTNGVVTINLTGLNREGPFLPIAIYDGNGKLVQSSNLTKYNEVFTGQVSLVVYPAGVYYIRFVDENMNRMVKVLKE